MVRQILTPGLTSGAVWSLVANGLGQLLPFVATLALARILSTAEYGRFVFLYTTAATLASLTGFSLGLTATRFVAAHYRGDAQRAGHVITGSIRAVLVVTLTVCCLALCTSSMLAAAYPNNASGTLAIFSTSCLFAVLSIGAVQMGVLAGLHHFRDIATGNAIRLLLGLGLAISFSRTGSSTGCILGLAFGGVAGLIANHRHLRAATRQHAIPLRWSEPAHMPWKTFAIPALLAYSVVAPIMWIGQLMLLSDPNPMLQVAVFNIGLQWRNLIVMIPAAVAQAAIPPLSRLYEAPIHTAPFTRLAILNVSASTLIAAIIAVVVAVMAPAITSAYGESYHIASAVVRVGALTGILMAFNNALGVTITATGNMWAGFTFNSFWALAVLIQAIPLTRTAGALGLSIAVASAYLLHACWQSAYLLRTSRGPRFEHA